MKSVAHFEAAAIYVYEWKVLSPFIVLSTEFKEFAKELAHN